MLSIASSIEYPTQPTLFEQDSDKYNPEMSDTHGKIFVLEQDRNSDGNIDIKDLDWDYLQGDGDLGVRR